MYNDEKRKAGFFGITAQLCFFAMFLCGTVTTGFCASHEAKDALKEKQQQLNEIYKRLEYSKQKLTETKQQEQSVINKLFIINRDLKQTKGQLSRAQYQIQRNESKIGYLQGSLEEAKTRMDSKSAIFSKRINEIYRTGGVNFFGLLLTSDTLADFISRSYFFEKIMGRDMDIVSQIIQEHTKIKQNKNELEGLTVEIKKLAKSIEGKKTYIENLAEEKQKVYKSLEQRKIEYEKNVIELEQSSKEIEQMIKKIIAERPTKGKGVPHSTGTFIWPLQGRITSPFGYRKSPIWGLGNFHTGLDIANSYGTPIRAADSGEVIYAGWWRGYGKMVIIDHGKGISTLYGHMSRIYAQKDQKIEKGQMVGLVGTTGWSTGPHLHFEVRKNGVPQNPIRWLP